MSYADKTQMIKARLVSSLEKCFPDGRPEYFRPVESVHVFKNQRISLQIAIRADRGDPFRRWVRPECRGLPAECVSFREVGCVPSDLPAYPGKSDEGYLRTEPGLFPDILEPLQMEGLVRAVAGSLRAVWIDIDMNAFDWSGITGPSDLPVSFSIFSDEPEIVMPLTLKLIPAELPDTGFRVTQWFHSDCLASYYNVDVFSERHWEIIENFMRTFVRCGNNTILTPVFTPPLDTHIGGERPTVQLVKVKKGGNGRYYFDFALLDRWIDTADRCGVKYFEISHLFTQWGAKHAPKIMAETPEGYRRIFGWETDATGKDYPRFLRAFIQALLSHLKARGDDRRCLFHISDEPNREQLDQYLASKATVADLLDGYTVIDALSNVDFYLSGAVQTPVPSNNHIEPFIKAFADEGREGLWTYYCCGQSIGVSNRLMAMTGARTRFIGTQFWKYKIAGFLQWGFNFYYNCGSYDLINPYINSTGSGWVPSGDTYSVYPASDGRALESVRINHFREGLDDMRALSLLESLIGREKTLEAVESVAGEIVFSRCVCGTAQMLALRDRIDSLIAENLTK